MNQNNKDLLEYNKEDIWLLLKLYLQENQLHNKRKHQDIKPQSKEKLKISWPSKNGKNNNLKEKKDLKTEDKEDKVKEDKEEKIEDKEVTEDKKGDKEVTEDKIGDKEVTEDKIEEKTEEEDKGDVVEEENEMFIHLGYQNNFSALNYIIWKI
jgi:hypothetical protein